SRRIAPAAGVHLAHGSEALRDGIVDCLARYGRRHQFARWWTATTLASPERVRGLGIQDFTVALRGDRVVACVACWDQRAFKQATVRGYSSRLARWRPVLNAISPLTRSPYLPPVGQRLECAYLSHFAVDDDRPDVAMAVIADACATRPSDIDYVLIGIGS